MHVYETVNLINSCNRSFFFIHILLEFFERNAEFNYLFLVKQMEYITKHAY